ncbi:C2H2 transcription factor [Dichotomopilus funicola]|uniref:C2H2 transcription factor n=1 Tax=Dichotomopilus funicola TaxID=1934379 RepID=A0AAN6ZNH9_9PEZI|nr:C2H2 transcription factor [Dichotomopilus funicola]
MDEFVNWDQADPAPVPGLDMSSPSLMPNPDQQQLDDLDLALANVAGDDFSFWALQHFENNISPTMPAAEEIPMPTDRSTRTFEDHLEHVEAPCQNCQLGGYQCKRIPEGQYKGYCTSCVALRCACSFGLTGVAFPSNPWPVMGDHPELLQEEKHAEPHHHQSGSGAGLAGRASSTGEGPKGKSGARFSRESVKILKNWLSTHSKHPYPNDEEKEMLQNQTGLNKTQITNWLANTRRRNKNAVAQRSTSPGVRNWANPIDIPQRRRSPLEHMNPLQRWQHSPPENEPASVTAIARAVDSAPSISSGLNSPYSAHFTDDGSGRSLCDSNISSANTSNSSTSAYSHGSRGSFGSAGSSIPRGRRRRRRKVPATAAAVGGPSRGAHTGPAKTFQCTFCTETFRTKHDWQRHEKSLHLSLERWVCSPNGAQVFNPETGQMACVFCGHANPDEAHADSHNHSVCQERTIGERTFYRKDHLRQHLKLVHGTNFISWSMEQWKATTPEIRSRCGFCGTVMDTWSIRVDHLAQHFKDGKSMADWKGDWGFDIPVLNMVENSIPPYLIHDERNSPNPYEASQPSAASARHAFELIKSELSFYVDDWREKEGVPPSDEVMQRAACTLIYDCEEVSEATNNSKVSWLRDLIFSSERLAQEARWSRAKTLDCWQQLRINGKSNIFESDPMEAELQQFVKARRLLGLTAMDSELQTEACRILRRMETSAPSSSEHVVQFLLRLINASPAWLADFRQRAHLPRSEDLADEGKRSKDPMTIDSTIHNPSRLEYELAEYIRVQRAMGTEPTDADLQKHARMIIFEYEDEWNQTQADDPAWLAAFRQRHATSSTGSSAGAMMMTSAATTQPSTTTSSAANYWCQSVSTFNRDSSSNTGKPGTFYLNDANCYQRLARELKKWVTSTMSPNNPNCHVPTDEELQHQARWIVYEDDDPWNQTAADNCEWLRRFKRDVAIVTDAALPGLPLTLGWNIAQGGSGFSPPYVFPNPIMANSLAGSLPSASSFPNNNTTPATTTTTPITLSTPPQTTATPANVINVTLREGAKPILTAGSTANRFMRGLADARRHDPPASVFCSRELERDLAGFVMGRVRAAVAGGENNQTSGSPSGSGNNGEIIPGFPTDDELRARARILLHGSDAADTKDNESLQHWTPADDEVLLARFREMMKTRLGLHPLLTVVPTTTAATSSASTCPFNTTTGIMNSGAGGLDPGFASSSSAAAGVMDFSAGAIDDLAAADALQQMELDFADLSEYMDVATGGMPMDKI